ncbi:hypothetical protein BX666DRAFT_358218 [Dichotomocladium elegans]|nr:hypothetical protein BX666DRAFT_358218 [Dichotomocladium elegans]
MRRQGHTPLEMFNNDTRHPSSSPPFESNLSPPIRMTVTQQRGVGLLEKYQISKLLTKCYGSVSNTALLRHRTARPDSDPEAIQTFYLKALHPALSRLVKKHPFLSVIPVDVDQPTAHFALLESYDLRDIVHVNPSFRYWEHLSDLIRGAVKYEFDHLRPNGLPMWSLQIDVHPDRPYECAMTLIVYHLIMDGRSVLVFWRDLLNELKMIGGGESQQQQPFVVACDPDAVVPPPYEERNPVLRASTALWGTKEDEAQMWQGDYEANRDPATAQCDTDVRQFKVDGDAWAKIVSTSKSHGVTPHAPIMIACVSAFAELYPGRVLRTMTAVNTRPLCNPPVPDDEFGNFFGVFFKFWRSAAAMHEKKSFWDQCIEYQNFVREHKTSAAAFTQNVLRPLESFPESFCRFWTDNLTKYALGRPGGIALSDLGILRTDAQSSEWTLEEIYFSQAAHMYTLAMGLNVISLPHGMFGTLCWHKGAVDPAKADRFGGLVAKKLEEIAGQ